MPSKRTILLSLTLVSAILLGLHYWKSAPAPGREIVPSSSGRATTPPAASVPDNPILPVFANLAAPPDSTASLRSLTDLKTRLLTMPRAAAMDWVQAFLASGSDKPTGLTYEIAPGGSLAAWPSFRVFLLDVLPEIDPAAAAALGRSLLATPTTADEWSLALRNVGREDSSPETKAFLRAKTEELISYPAWQIAPSVGYLNAFDVLVHTGAVESIPLVSALIQRKDRKDLSHAGFLTLDRLVQLKPEEALTRLAADTALQQNRPEMTAQQFARADLRDPQQINLVKTWLLDPARTGTELQSFAGVFPNHNTFVSNNLLTPSAPPPVSLREHDAAVLEIVRSWQEDPAFEPIAPHMEVMLRRLSGFAHPPSTVR